MLRDIENRRRSEIEFIDGTAGDTTPTATR